MKDVMSYEYHKEKLAKEEARLKELNEKGVQAFYKDEEITPASIGQQNRNLEASQAIIRSHIQYHKDQIAEHEAIGVQEKLF